MTRSHGLLLLALALALIITPNAHAFTAKVTGVTITVEYDEPGFNADDSALLDLDHTSIYYNMGAADTKARDVPASAKTGNGHIQIPVDVPVLAGMERTVNLWATASDETGNESGRSNTVTVRVDRLPPGPPK